MKLDNEKLVTRPLEYKELIHTINNFKAIIASRLHACIIGYSLYKPIVGLYWNDKVLFFGEAIKHPERFSKPKDTDAKSVVDKLEKAISEGYD